MKLFCFVIILLSFVPFGRAIFDIADKWKEKKHGVKLISVLAWFFLSLFMVRFAEVLFVDFVSDPGALPRGASGILAAVSQGGIHALQSFSMDESYGEMLAAGLAIVKAFLPGSVPAFIFTLYFAIQNLAAPLAGGAILLDILTGVSADLQIKWRQHMEKHVFSCATSQSIALAESIPGMNKGKVAIFTDFTADSDDEGEGLRERMEVNDFIFTDDHLTALKIGAAKAPLFFYLMDEDEEDNVNQLLEIWSMREALLEGCRKKDVPSVTVFFFTESDKSLRLVMSLAKRCADDPRIEIKIIDTRLNLVANLSSKDRVSERLDAISSSRNAAERKIAVVSDNVAFAARLISTFILYCESVMGEGDVRPRIALASTVDGTGIERQFESVALSFPKSLRQTINPDRLFSWDGTDAGLNELAGSADALGGCSIVVVAGDSDLRSMQKASVLDRAYCEAGLADADKPVIACLIRNDVIAEQFKDMFGPHVVPFGCESEMNSYETACTDYYKETFPLLFDQATAR